MKALEKSDFIKKNSEKGAKWIAKHLNITENNVYVSASKLGIKLGKGRGKSKKSATKQKTPSIPKTTPIDYREKLDSLYRSKHDSEEYLNYVNNEIEITIKLIK